MFNLLLTGCAIKLENGCCFRLTNELKLLINNNINEYERKISEYIKIIDNLKDERYELGKEYNKLQHDYNIVRDVTLKQDIELVKTNTLIKELQDELFELRQEFNKKVLNNAWLMSKIKELEDNAYN